MTKRLLASVFVAAASLYCSPVEARAGLEARWSEQEVKDLVSALNANDSTRLARYLTVIDGRLSLDLRGVNLAGQVLKDVWLVGQWETHFDNADLTRTTLHNVDLRGAHLNFTKANGTKFSGRTRLDYARISNSDFSGSELAAVSFVGARLTNVSFGAASFQGVDFFGAQVVTASFDSARLEDVRFLRAKLRNVSFFGSTAVGVVFEGARLDSVKFRMSVMNNVDFDYAELISPDLRDAVTSNLSLAGAQVWRPWLTGWNFDSVDFRYAIWKDSEYRLGEDVALFKGESIGRRRLVALQVKNAYRNLATKYEEYGYPEAARTFTAFQRRLDNRLIRPRISRAVHWLANEVTDEYGSNPGQLVLAAISTIMVFAVLYLVMAYAKLEWCLVREATSETTFFVSFGRPLEDDGQEGGDNDGDGIGRNWIWLWPGQGVRTRQLVINCMALSLNMILFSAGGFLKIPQLLSLTRLRSVEYNLRGAGRILAGLESVVGLWLIYLLVRDLVEIVGG